MPWDLDHAVLRRLPKRLYVPLPGKHARQSLLAAQLKKHNSKVGLRGDISESDIQYIVERTEGKKSAFATCACAKTCVVV